MFEHNLSSNIIRHHFSLRYDVVTKCWAGKVEERPTFSDVVTLLSQCLEGLTGYTVLEVNWMKGDSFVKGESQLEENQYLD